eukprot:CAMPEP_0197520424 /NCGR_PEP_ID=MMETSP1318-20131121/5775_1 /TAXON_ID=552666 /ORGANISM="Partenskyella glossopodia, Strain RCC365" /LENGTH=321 /DNA_ID=CAMNT_0043071985 /DNA_START=22 /DNA_END=984 /DNA_ORIENTATION=-
MESREYEDPGAPISVPLDRASTATQLLEMRRQMQEVQDVLEAQKTIYIEKEEAFSRREDNLRNKDLELQEALVLFNRYLKRNESKQKNAKQAAEFERKQKEIKVAEIAKKTKEIGKLREKWEELKKKVEQNEKYKDFLHQVYTKHPEDFDERDHIMHRYKSLKKTHEELNIKQKENERKVEELSKLLKDETKAQQNRTLELNNKYAKSSKTFEKILEHKNKEMTKLEFEEHNEAARRLRVSSCIMAVDNLYKRCCTNKSEVMQKNPSKVLRDKHAHDAETSKKQKQTKDPHGIENQVDLTLRKLGIIANYLEDYKSIVEMW